MPLEDRVRAELADLVRSRGYERRQEPFRLSSGGWSHDYVDCRHVVATGDALRRVSEAMMAVVEVSWDVVGGPTMGADPLAHAIALLSGASWLSVRKAPKGHGTGSWIEGHRLSAGDRVLVVEDTVSTGAGLLNAVERITEAGGVVVAATTILDRSPAVALRLAETGLVWCPLLSWEDLGIAPL